MIMAWIATWRIMTKGDGIKKKFLNNLVVSEKHFTFADDKLNINIKSITMDELQINKDLLLAVKIIKQAILESQYRAAKAVNREQLALYYSIGKYVSDNYASVI